MVLSPLVGSSWPVITAKLVATRLCVTGMPAYSATAMALVTPGTNSKGRPASKFKGQACFQKLNGFFAAAAKYKGVAAFKAGNGFAFGSKFYQQPNTKGSPPLRRATVLPSAASFTNSLLISGWRMVWLAEALPT